MYRQVKKAAALQVIKRATIYHDKLSNKARIYDF